MPAPPIDFQIKPPGRAADGVDEGGVGCVEMSAARFGAAAVRFLERRQANARGGLEFGGGEVTIFENEARDKPLGPFL